MARRLRIQFPGARYHIINRGNYRTDVFGSVGAAQAFEATLYEACDRFGWRLQAFVIMRNHFHLALETTAPTLSDGMHWLQGTYALRFNRYRGEQGHLFQGRYRALVVEDMAAMRRVIDYIHLNPVRSRIILPEQVALFRWSSLLRFRAPQRAACLDNSWLLSLATDADPSGWNGYAAELVALAKEERAMEVGQLSRGWAIGTSGWRRAIAKEYRERALSPGLSGEELLEMKSVRWQEELERALDEANHNPSDAAQQSYSCPWKLAIARRLRHIGASCAWIAEKLSMGSAANVRVYLSRNQHVAP